MLVVVSLICLGPSFQKMTHHFLLHGSLLPTNLEKNLNPCYPFTYRFINNKCGVYFIGPFLEVFGTALRLVINPGHLIEEQWGWVVIG